jgi:hypothetical protein
MHNVRVNCIIWKTRETISYQKRHAKFFSAIQYKVPKTEYRKLQNYWSAECSWNFGQTVHIVEKRWYHNYERNISYLFINWLSVLWWFQLPNARQNDWSHTSQGEQDYVKIPTNDNRYEYIFPPQDAILCALSDWITWICVAETVLL